MYESFFGFSEKPFRNTPDPRFLYSGKKHGEALVRLINAVRSGRGLAVLSGEAGTGKTTIVRAIMERLDESFQISYIFNPKLPVTGFLEYACYDFGVRAKGRSIGDYRKKLHDFLTESRHAGKTSILIVDEAQNLDVALFEEIRTLTNLETSRQKLLQIVLVGQPELIKLLEQTELWELKQRISTRYHLVALDQKETEEYIQTRMCIAGAKELNCFTRGAIEKIYEHSQGVPRLINNICDHSLLIGYAKNKPVIDTKTVRECVTDLRLGDLDATHKARRGTKPDSFGRHLPVPASVLILIIGLFVAGILFYLLGEKRAHHGPSEPGETSLAPSDRISKTGAGDVQWPKREMAEEEALKEPVLVLEAEASRDPATARTNLYGGSDWKLTEVSEKIEPSQAPDDKESSRTRIENARADNGSRTVFEKSGRPEKNQKVEKANPLPKETAQDERLDSVAKLDEPLLGEKEIVAGVREIGGPKKKREERTSEKRVASYFIDRLELANLGIDSLTKVPETGTFKDLEEESLKKREEHLIEGGETDADRLPAEEEEVKQFLAEYIERYNQKDLEGFLSLFSFMAVQNWTDKFEEIEKTYTRFFDQSEELGFHLEDVSIRFYQNAVRVRARYEVDQLLKKGEKKKVWRGAIRWVLFKENGALKIRYLDYIHQTSPSWVSGIATGGGTSNYVMDPNR